MLVTKKKTILITGGNGYIGSCLSTIASSKFNIVVIDKKNRNIFLTNKNIINFKCDINNFKKLDYIFKKTKPDIVVHLAAQSTIDFITLKKDKYFEDNIKGTENILKICIRNKIQKFIFSSTAAVYKEKSTPLDEKNLLKPNNLYGQTKLRNEIKIQKYLKNSITKFCILRFFNVCSALKDYKIGEFHSPETHLIPKVIYSIINKRIIYIYGNNYNTNDGTCIRDYIHIKDIINGILLTIDYLDNNKSAVFNLGSSRELSVLKIIEKCSQILKMKPLIKTTKKRKGDLPKLNCKIDQAKVKLKWKPKNSNLSKIIKDEIWWFKYLEKNKITRNFFTSK